MIERITNLGDAALLLPASLLLFLHLLWRDDPKRAFAFALATGACLTITVALKLVFLIWSVDVFGFRVHSPSGHTSFGATFYGCCAALASSGAAPWRQKIVRFLVGALIAAVGLSRVAVDAHSLSEVVIGLVIGFGCVALFVSLPKRPQVSAGLLQIVVCVAVLAIALNGRHLTLEPLLQRLADRLVAEVR
jgi:membrane-associated phospholipid phosphatase